MRSNHDLLAPRERGTGSRIATAAALCLVALIAGIAVYSEIVTGREFADPPAALSRRQFKRSEAPRLPETLQRPDAEFVLKDSLADDRPVGGSVTGPVTPAPAQRPSNTFAEVESEPAASAEPEKTSPAQSEPPTTKPKEKSRTGKKRSARGDGRVHRFLNDDGGNSAPWAGNWGMARADRRSHLAYPASIQWWR